jgi:hypothetical protein
MEPVFRQYKEEFLFNNKAVSFPDAFRDSLSIQGSAITGK